MATQTTKPALIQKRNKSFQELSLRKIERAILLAFSEVSPESIPDVRPIAESALKSVSTDTSGVLTINEIQNAVEKALMSAGYHDVAKAYILYRANQDAKRQTRLTPDNMALAEYLHNAKYARFIPGKHRKEVHSETVDRVEQMNLNRFPELSVEIRNAFEWVRKRKIIPSMRSMQFAGMPMERANARCYNCSFSPIDRVRFFQEAFYLLLCGCGVGYSVQWHHVNKLPSLAHISKHSVYHHTIEDSIEGWSDALGALIQSYVDGRYIEFDYSEIRHEGSPISSGGKAPGHIPLKEALEKIRAVLHKAQGRSLRPIECHDIVCYTAEAVLAGGIRRSSLISLFSPDDGEMMRCKTSEVFRPSFSEGDPGVNNQRQMANNSAVFLRNEVKKSQFQRLMTLASQSWGEPGFFFTENLDYGTNPCAEISLNPMISLPELYELEAKHKLSYFAGEKERILQAEGQMTGFAFCNLTEINMARIASKDEFYAAAKAAAFIGTLQAAYNQFPYLGAVTEAIQRREALLGVSLTGMADNPEIAFDKEAQTKAALAAVEENKRVAAILGIRPAARVTTVKPSGTASVVLGVVGSGIHPHHARRYFRRINGNKNEPAAVFFKSINPHMVENKPDGTWSLVFPIQAPDNAITIKEESALLFLERVFSTYEHWIKPGTAIPELSPGATHNVSCTVTVRDNELESVIEEVWKNKHRIAAMSFAPYSLDKMFPFAPREEVTTSEDEEKWNRLIRHYKPVDWSEMVEETDTANPQAEVACGGGSCDIL